VIYLCLMRIWDLPPEVLCRKHLAAEHRELHGIWNILTIHGGKGGYSRHPETLRWTGKLMALYIRHNRLVAEMGKRRWHHRTPLDRKQATGYDVQDEFLVTAEEQLEILLRKSCGCPLK